jgi:hypothetical protein
MFLVCQKPTHHPDTRHATSRLRLMGATLLMDKAHRIARSLQFGIKAKRGVLPARRPPAR